MATDARTPSLSRSTAWFLGTVVVLVTLIVCGSVAHAVTLDLSALGSRTDESTVATTIYVDHYATAASDGNPGTLDKPFKTIARAAQLAMDFNARGVAVRVMIAPGPYRESVQLPPNSAATSAPMVFEAATPGGAVIKGSDVWTDWRTEDAGGLVSHDWPYAWGLAPYPDGWACCVVLSDLMRRREMVFANDQRLKQVLTQQDLIPGSFYISEASHTIYMRLPANMSISSTTVEVAVRAGLFLVQGRSNVVLRGLVFRHDASMIGTTAALTIRNASDVRIDQCTMEWNNYQGLGIATADHVSVTKTVSNSNGSTGVAAWQLTSAIISDGETSYNNWRGQENGMTDWDPSGTKLMLLRDTAVLRQKANGNLTYGFWLDTDCVNVLVDSVTSTNNVNDGIFLEAVEGPIEIRGSILSNNTRAGVLGGNASNVTLTSNVLNGNGNSQILLSGNPLGRPVLNFKSGQSTTVQSVGWTLTANIITADVASQALIATTLPPFTWQAFVGSLNSDWNSWFNSVNRSAFRWANGQAIDFDTWRALTLLDGHSCGCAP